MKTPFAFALLVLLGMGCATPPKSPPPSTPVRVAFGSCLKQGKPQPIWGTILAADPDVFIFAGDNIYADTEDMDVMRRKYEQLGGVPGFQELRDHCPVVATWDDHDYGVNDGGAEYPKKEEAKREMFSFFEEPADSPRWDHPGVYGSRMVERGGLRVQVILLDTRTFRGPLVRHDSAFPDRGPYQPTADPAATVLGEAQWEWLAAELVKPADWRMVVSSIQVVASEHHWEGWMNFPHEQERLYRLIRETKAEGVIFLSGDRHHGELSREDDAVGYPLYDLTASGMNNAFNRPKDEANRYRVGEMMLQNHFGLLLFDTDKVRMQLLREDGTVVLKQDVPLRELKPVVVR